MVQKQMFKVLAQVSRRDGTGTWLMRVGSGYRNRDGSINAYVDALPVGLEKGGLQLQIRELDADEVRARESHRSKTASLPPSHGTQPATAAEPLPF